MPEAAASPEAQLAERVDEHLKRCLDHAAEGLHRVGTAPFCGRSRTELDLLRYTAYEYIGRDIQEFQVDRPVTERIPARLTRRETLLTYGAHTQRRHKNGWLTSRDGIPVRDHDGVIIGAAKMARDI